MYNFLKNNYRLILIIFLSYVLLNIIKNILNIYSIIIIIILTIILSNRNKRLFKKILYKVFFNSKSIKINNKIYAVKKSLKSISEIKSLVNDQVNSEIINIEKNKIEGQLLKSDYKVILFGTGSCGKTSLARALLNNMVGEISPTYGTTKRITSYKINIPFLKRNINIIDTPGLFEASIQGEKREKSTLKKVSQSDLVLFVIDQDLNKYEIYLIRELFKIGKSLIIVLNKCDLRSTNQNKLIKKNIYELISNFSNRFSIVETIASTKSISNSGGISQNNFVQVDNLFSELIKILEKDGEELLADNILLQCNKLGLLSKKIINEQRENISKKIINKYAWITSGVIFITPLPGIDLLATTAINFQMIIEISKIYGVNMSIQKAKKLTKSIITAIASLGVVKGGTSLISNILSTNFTTKFISKTIQSFTAAWVIKIVGMSFVRYFNQNQEWGDGGIQSVVEELYELNKRDKIIKEFIKEAIQKIKFNDKNLLRKKLPPHY